MAREINKLSARTVTALNERGRYADGGGLYLQVAKGGSKTWLFRFQMEGQSRQMGLGSVNTFSLSEARQKANDCRKLIYDGIDPIEHRRVQKAKARAAEVKVHTFAECANKLISAKSREWKNLKHTHQWTATLETYAFPHFGDLDVRDVDVARVLEALEPIWNEKQETARRLRGRIEAVLDYAKARGYREGENPARWKGHLDHILARKSAQLVKHHGALPYDQVADLMSELEQLPGVAPKGLAFLILTAARTGEVIGATWDEVCFESNVWTIPAVRMKAGKDHRVPLTEPAVSILREMQSGQQSEHVFPGWKKGTALSNMAFLTLLKKKMGRSGITVHGFRSSFKDWATECTNFPNEVSEMALAHAIGNKVEAAYRRGDLMDKRRDLMAQWADFCAN